MKNISPTRKNTSDNSISKGIPDIRNATQRVFVGMSGGVDSAVSAHLLKEAGYDVTGVFIRVWQPEDTDCGWKEERRDAMRVAAALDIPFLTYNFSDEYKKEVVDYMLSEYQAGRTPNPDVMCNRHIKFGSFLQEALKAGADYVATGHYAKNIQAQDGSFELHESADKEKDQSYFLWTLAQEDLKHVLFPIGHLQKNDVRKIAEKNKLPVFDKKDSQGVCFIGHLDMKAFLKANIEVKKGKVLDIHNAIIGEHDGAALYTVGERHGFTVFNTNKKESKGVEDEKGGTKYEPHYIISKNMEKNTLTVATESAIQANPEEHAPKEVKLTGAQWVGKAPEAGKKYSVRIRYRQEKKWCEIRAEHDGTATLIFDKPEKGVAEGQSAVVYDGDTCLGGGILGLI
jgi:tRNA-specific 2-thiouridylase